MPKYKASGKTGDNNAPKNMWRLMHPRFLFSMHLKVLVTHFFCYSNNMAKSFDLLLIKYPGHTQFVCTVNGDNYEEIISYNEIINPIENQEDEYIFCKLKRIITHEEPIITSNSNYKLS